MPPKKISNTEDYWYLILSILLIILIFFIGVLIYVIYTKKPTNISCPVPQTQYVERDNRDKAPPVQIINKQPENIPVYPNKLPQYNNQEYQQVGILTANENKNYLVYS